MLKSKDKAIIHEALNELESKGPERSARRWWAFEGFTEVDCLIETDRFVIAVEGKRTEKGPAESISWYPKRNQIIRNIEVLQQYANGKLYGVIMIEEKGEFKLSNEEIAESLPHLSVNKREELLEHFFGVITWKDLCEKTSVDYDKQPNTIYDIE